MTLSLVVKGCPNLFGAPPSPLIGHWVGITFDKQYGVDCPKKNYLSQKSVTNCVTLDDCLDVEKVSVSNKFWNLKNFMKRADDFFDLSE